jgi:hypothetical protein
MRHAFSPPPMTRRLLLIPLLGLPLSPSSSPAFSLPLPVFSAFFRCFSLSAFLLSLPSFSRFLFLFRHTSDTIACFFCLARHYVVIAYTTFSFLFFLLLLSALSMPCHAMPRHVRSFAYPRRLPPTPIDFHHFHYYYFRYYYYFRCRHAQARVLSRYEPTPYYSPPTPAQRLLTPSHPRDAPSR